MENKEKLPFSRMLGYSLGTNIRVVENIFAFYFVYYLTTVAGVDPGIAGIISSCVVLWAACISPIIGHFADRPGRKRKLVLITTVPISVLLFLLFSTFNFGATGNVVYFVIVGCLCYSIYYMFLIPYDSLGAELSEGYNTRTTMRGLCTAFVYISGIVGGTLTLFLQGKFVESGMSLVNSWHVAVLASCALILIAGISSYISTRSVDKKGEASSEVLEKPQNIFKSYKEMLKLKPFVALVLFCLIYFIGTTILATDIVYYGIYSLGLSEAAASLFFTVATVATLIAIAPATALINKLGKKRVLIMSLWILIIIALVVFVKGPTSYLDGWAIMIGYSLTNATVLIAIFSMLYDVSELAEFVTGRQKVGAAVGALTFGMGIAQSIAYALFGFILKTGGYDAMAMEQTGKAIDTITLTATVIPAALVFVSMITLVLYKINKKNYEALLSALNAKREGKEYSTEGFKELL